MASCFFKSRFNCEDGNLTTAGPARIQTIVKFSKEYKDDFYLTLEEKLRDNPNVKIGCHRNCVSTYTSKERLNRHRKRESCAAESDPSQPPIKPKKFVSVGTEKEYDTTVIYSRVIGIQASSRELDLKKVLRHELAPVPTSMFHDSGAARMCKAKSDLKKRLARESSSRIVETNQAAIVLDGSAILWVVHWPAKGKVVDFVNNFKKYISNKLHESDVYLVFDRYRDYSTKSVTREGRASDASRLYQLSENRPLPSQKAVLTVSANKKPLIGTICGNLASDVAFHTQHYNLFIIIKTRVLPALCS